MTILGEAVLAELQRRGQEIGLTQIEKILLDAGVPSAASRGVPSRLRIHRLHVIGTKHYQEKTDEDTGLEEMKNAPINLDWKPVNGVNGVGSEVNLRGKSSVLHLAMWALTGRSHLQPDVVSWIDRVNAEFRIDEVPLYVEFDVTDGVPVGEVQQQLLHGDRALLGAFSGEAEFESVMGSVMLERLRLDAISVFSNGVEVEHTWPSYAAALTVHADKLDPIIGNENTLKTRILQMFFGTSWASVDARVAAALNSLKFDQREHEAQRQAGPSVSDDVLECAAGRVTAAKNVLEEFDSEEPNIDTIFALASEASKRASEAHDLSVQLRAADTAAAEVQAHLRVEELRQQAAVEDAVARRLFNGMTPTACPRCSTKVDAGRYAAEPTTHECSLCHHELDLDEYLEVSEAGTDGFGDTSLAEHEIDVEDTVDPLEALRAAVADAEQGVLSLREAYQVAEAQRREAEDAVATGREKIVSARARLRAELDLARAQSAFDALRDTIIDQPVVPNAGEELLVLEAASGLTKKWIKDDQEPLLESVSNAITALARQFGSANITSVKLKGNGNMDVFKGGTKTTYSGLTNGEKLRIKIATVIALIKLGHRDGVGRHPGLFFVDSPGSEEIPESNLKIILEAMTAVAEETDLQIVVATTHSTMLGDVLPKANLLVARGTDFVW